MQWLVLISASLAIVSGWFFYFVYRESYKKWREFIVLVTAIYLTASVPVFFFEFSQVKWFMRGHRWPSFYVRPWVHWGLILTYLGVVGSFLARGRARLAFVTASILLAILWESMSRWVF